MLSAGGVASRRWRRITTSSARMLIATATVSAVSGSIWSMEAFLLASA
jgi:hypothetical protein